MLMRETLALDTVDATGRLVKEYVDQVVGQQVDLVDVEHAAVRRREQAGANAKFAGGQGHVEVDGPNNAILGRANGQLDERGPARHERGESPSEGRLGAPLLTPDDHTP